MEPYEGSWKDYYDILGVSPQATPSEIKTAYRRLARKHHPDQTQDPSATKTMADINEAYEVLSDLTRKSKYDLMFAAMRKRVNIAEYSAKESYSQEIKGTATKEDKELPWIVPVITFCCLFLVGIFISVVREQLAITAIWLSFLWALFSFVAIFAGRALVMVIIDLTKRLKIRKTVNKWYILGGFTTIPLTLISVYAAVKFLQMLLFEPLAH